MTKRFAYLLLALALATPLAACNDDMDDRRESTDESVQQTAPADSARPAT